jgi:hypothetical protein
LTQSDAVSFRGAVGIGEQGDIDQDILGAVPLPVIDADNSSHQKVFDNHFVHGLHSSFCV